MASGWYNHVVRTDILKHYDFSNSEEHPDDLPLCPDGCNLELFEASRHWWASGRMLLTDERPDGIPRRPDDW